MKTDHKLLFSCLMFSLLASTQTAGADNQSGCGNCWDQYYDPPAETTQVVQIDPLGIEVTIPSNYEIPLNRKWGRIDIIGSEKAGRWLFLADNGVQPEGSICSQSLEKIPRKLEISFEEQVMEVATQNALPVQRYMTENMTAYLIHSSDAKSIKMMILMPDQENILLLHAFCSDCSVDGSKLIDLANKIKFIEN